METLQANMADPRGIPDQLSKQTKEIATEARNVFLETPEGLAGPKYSVVSSGKGV